MMSDLFKAYKIALLDPSPVHGTAPGYGVGPGYPPVGDDPAKQDFSNTQTQAEQDDTRPLY